jgi:hypothetical protein
MAATNGFEGAAHLCIDREVSIIREGYVLPIEIEFLVVNDGRSGPEDPAHGLRKAARYAYHGHPAGSEIRHVIRNDGRVDWRCIMLLSLTADTCREIPLLAAEIIPFGRFVSGGHIL